MRVRDARRILAGKGRSRRLAPTTAQPGTRTDGPPTLSDWCIRRSERTAQTRRVENRRSRAVGNTEAWPHDAVAAYRRDEAGWWQVRVPTDRVRRDVEVRGEGDCPQRRSCGDFPIAPRKFPCGPPTILADPRGLLPYSRRSGRASPDPSISARATRRVRAMRDLRADRIVEGGPWNTRPHPPLRSRAASLHRDLPGCARDLRVGEFVAP